LRRRRVYLTKARIAGLKKRTELKEFLKMKTRKISLVAVLALSLTLGLAASSMARPGGGMGGGMGCGMGVMNLTPDQAGKFFDLKEKFHSDTTPVRKQMMIKRAELGALQKSATPDQAAITAKQAEIKALWAKMQEKRTAFQAEAGKISPDLAKGFGRGMHGGKGPGCGMGPGNCPMAGPSGAQAPAGCPMMPPSGAQAPAAPAK
jgi:Spy/CpxP family protein refolding chaperone